MKRYKWLFQEFVKAKSTLEKIYWFPPINRRISLDISKPLSSLQRAHCPRLSWARCIVEGKIIFIGNGDLARYTSGTACLSKIDISPTQRKKISFKNKQRVHKRFLRECWVQSILLREICSVLFGFRTLLGE